MSTTEDYDYVIHVASVWKAKKKKLLPENQVVWPELVSCPNITCFLPECGHLKNSRGATAPPPRRPMNTTQRHKVIFIKKPGYYIRFILL